MAVSSGLRKRLIVAAALVGAFGLLVGYAHWYVHDLETGDVAWSAPTAYGRTDADQVEIVVVAGRIYTYDRRRLVIRDLRTGRPIAVTNPAGFQPQVAGGCRPAARYDPRRRGAYFSFSPSGKLLICPMQTARRDAIANAGPQAYVGDGGQVALFNAARHRLAFYSRDGKELWNHDGGPVGTPLAIGADGGLDVISCHGTSCDTVHYDDAGHVTARTARRSRNLARAATIDSPGRSPYAAEPILIRVPPVPIDIDGHSTYQLRDGRRWGTAVATTDGHTLAQVGDLLVGLSRRGGTCVFAAVRSGRPAWTTSTPCPGLGTPALTVFAHRLYAYTDDGKWGRNGGAAVVSTDLDGVRAVHTYIRRPIPPNQGDFRVEPAPRVLIISTDREAVAYSPTTGAELWQLDLHHNSGYTDDAGHHENVGPSGAIVELVRDTRPPWPQLAIGRDTPPRTLSLLDPVTGDTLASVGTSRWQAGASYGTADGAVIVIDGDRIRLVRPGGGR